MNLQRHEAILNLMEKQNIMSIKELAAQLGCTEMTVRRNLDEMQAKGLVKRSHGFASLERSGRHTDYYEEIHENAEEKKAIAREAYALIRPGMSICLDSGTTVQQLVELLGDDLPLSVITPSLVAAMTLSSRPQIQVMMPGGFLHHGNRSLLVDESDRLVSRYHADIAFLSCRSFQLPGGTFEHSQTLTNTKRALASLAEKKILLLDHSKWNVSSIFNCIPLESLDILITGPEAPAQSVDRARELGLEVIVAGCGEG